MRPSSVALDAHLEADDALIRGWRAKASQILLRAVVREPSRDDLRRRMVELNALSEGAAQRFTSGANRAWSAVHFLMGFVVQFALLAGIFTLGVTLAFPLFGEGPVGGIAQFVLVLALCMGYCLLLVLAWSRLYLALWFGYLRWVPRHQAPNAASWLAAYITCWQFSREYWRRKDKFYAERYGA